MSEETPEAKKRGRPPKKDKEEKPEEESLSRAEKQRRDMDQYLGAVNKKLGEGSIVGAASGGYKAIPRLSTSIFQLDYALGGGIPRGRVSLVVGGESSSKTRLVYAIIADAQKRSCMNNRYLWEEMPEDEKIPCRCLHVDIEGSHTNDWAETCGVDVGLLHLARPTSQEQACEIIISALGSGNFDLIVADSIDSMIPSEEVEAAFDESNGFGTAKAKNNGKLFRRIQARLNEAAKNGTEIPTCVFVNQVRKKIGFMQHGNTYPGGDAQRFYSSVIIELSRGKTTYFDSEKSEPATVAFHFMIAKNKVYKPKVTGEFEMGVEDHPKLTFRKGQFLDQAAVFAQAEKFGIVETDGTWSCYGEKFKTKKELNEKYFKDEKAYLSMKEDILTRLFPKK